MSEINNTPRRDLLNEMGLEDSVVFENPDYDSAIIGYSDEYRIVYDFDLMVEHLMTVDNTVNTVCWFISTNCFT